MSDVLYYTKPYLLLVGGGIAMAFGPNNAVIVGGLVLVIFGGLILRMRGKSS